MIFDVILDAIESLLTWLAVLFPSVTLTPGAGLPQFFLHLADMNYFLPIKEVFAFTLGAFLAFPAIAGVSLLTWLVALIRGGSARG